jgi:hypothetical protein
MNGESDNKKAPEGAYVVRWLLLESRIKSPLNGFMLAETEGLSYINEKTFYPNIHKGLRQQYVVKTCGK